jgi:diketogulonate reductase-like aldo/keto reductase
MSNASHTVSLGSPSEIWPALGLGTWRFGESAAQAEHEVAQIHRAVEIGYRLFDTAEMYGEGGSERVLGRALADAMRGTGVRREQLRIVSKAYPHHASVAGLRRACDASRKRLQLDTIDLYLLHWRGDTPLAETLEGFDKLQQAGSIRHWGVSNFDLTDMQQLWRLRGGAACAANQVYYSLSERGAEFELLPALGERHTPLMAYCPIDGGSITRHAGLGKLAASLGASAARVALAWLLQQPGVIAIPKAGRAEHLLDNWQSQQMQIPEATLQSLEAMFPKPKRKGALAMR